MLKKKISFELPLGDFATLDHEAARRGISKAALVLECLAPNLATWPRAAIQLDGSTAPAAENGREIARDEW